MTHGIFGSHPKMALALGSDADTWTWKNTTPNAAVKTFQSQLNVYLKRFGYNPIGVDGKLGPATCGAWLHLMNTVPGAQLGPDFPPGPSNWGSVCQAWTYPTKVGNTKPETNPITQSSSPDANALPWLTASDKTTAAQQQVNSHLVGHDYLPIAVDGKMGPSFCGAARQLDLETGSNFLFNYGKNCQSFTPPTKKAPPVIAPTVTPTGPATGPIVPIDPGAPTAVATTGKKLSTASMVTGAAAIALVGAGIWYMKKKAG